MGVQVFFVLSGYVIYQSMERHLELGAKGAFTFIKKRFLRIYPALWASLVLSFFVLITIDKKTASLTDIISSATLTYPYVGGNAPQSVYWTLVYEQQFYLIMALLIFPFFNKTRSFLILISSLIAIGNELGILSNAWINSTLPNHWFEFMIGISAYFIHRDKNKKTAVLIFAVLAGVGFLGNYQTITAVVTGILLLTIYKYDSILDKQFFFPLKYLGRISYSLYLVHLPILGVVGLLTHSVWIALAACLMAGSISYYAFENPFMAKREKQIW